MTNQQFLWFYCPELDPESGIVHLNDEESYHAIKVMRIRPGEKVVVINGKGLIAECRFIREIKKQAEFEIENLGNPAPSRQKIQLCISAVKKRDKLEWIVEKATEIGVSDITFYSSEHSERSEINADRLEKIMIAAMKQSLNPRKPELHPLIKFTGLVKREWEPVPVKLIADCEVTSDNHIFHFLDQGKDTVVMIGPEGGFSQEEISLAVQCGFQPVSLGNNRLRVETAAVFVSSLISSFPYLRFP